MIRPSIVCLLLLSLAAPLTAQQGPRFDSRAALEARRDSLTLVMGSLDEGDERLQSVERRLAEIEQRLRLGDYRPGDVVGLRVLGQDQLTGNFPVQPDRTLVLEGVPPISLDGVLYSEAEEVILEGLRRVLRNPRIELASQMRLAVTGQVGNPGFYDVSGSLLLSDVIQLADGPTQSANLDGISVRRDGETILEGEELVTEALTLDDLGLRSGDVIRVPAEQDTFASLRTVSIVLGTLVSVIALIALL